MKSKVINEISGCNLTKSKQLILEKLYEEKYIPCSQLDLYAKKLNIEGYKISTQ